MNKRLDHALKQVRTLSDAEQEAAADILLEYIDAQKAGTWLTAAQVAEIERRLSNPMPPASDEDVAELFDRLAR
ncbi:MAG: hypothetical protein M5U33_05915 [Pseudorhodoplanes sp.]|nr:hypothetical protein [Pseudorhodoplanes sp.]MBW7950243.1 hypothetical protein [Pseudorhodoplanes sp.]MCL4713063.1 hypothetical protein [Pseudorhodoplanes sp.]MCZ7642344.1 hypothetical protein [Pseudorhodoplanes sp.]GIK82328.1 MAG: hypothetical protein BroJett024_34330 [Alphaproteobacteria bacterium]